MLKTDNVYVECQCSSADHVIRFVYDHADLKTNWPAQVYVEVQLHQWRNVFHRIWMGLKYICGSKCASGYWADTLISVQEADKLIKLLEEFKAETANYEKTKQHEETQKTKQ